MLTASTVVPSFALIGLAFIPIGLILLVTSRQVVTFTHDYTDCVKYSQSNQVPDGDICTINFTLPSQMNGRVYLYYILQSYYQSHRRFSQSRDHRQLHGFTSHQVDDNCQPFHVSQGKVIAPCGIAANALFNDTFTLTHATSGREVSIDRTHIAWPSDTTFVYRNPANSDSWFQQNTSKPPNWPVTPDQLNPGHESNGFTYEPFIVWMRTSAFPTFSKLYGRVFFPHINRNDSFLPAGKYTLTIGYSKFSPSLSTSNETRIIIVSLSLSLCRLSS